MKHKLIFLVLIIGSSLGCTKNPDAKNDWEIWNSFSTNKYYSEDVIPEKYSGCYGYWNVTGTSGGFHGGGYPKDFDELYLKKNGIFGIFRNDSLIAYGKIKVINNDDELLCQFEFDKQADINLHYNNEAYVQLEGTDSLSLIAPCCDRYNIHLKRKQPQL
jgi:hypothetical protein